VRLEIHLLIQELRDAKRTILMTTHYIEEAERLCDRVAIIDQGKIIEMGTPREIQQRTMGNSIIELHTGTALPAEIPAFAGAEKVHTNSNGTSLTAHSATPAKTLVDIVKWIDQSGIELTDIHLKRPTLEDVFIELTGKRLRD
jgi:ABC-2 type transport system ATP-binding protein